MSVSVRSFAVALGAFALVVGSVSTLAHFQRMPRERMTAGSMPQTEPTLAAVRPAEPVPVTHPLAGLDLSRIDIGDNEATTPLPKGRTAHLTVDPRLQKAAVAAIKQHKLPEAAIVMMDPETGAVLAYATRSTTAQRDLAVEAIAPSASVFKLATASALVAKGANAQTRACFPRSAEQRVVASDLVSDPLRDKWCMTLASAMGKSENAVFARMAHTELDKAALESAARGLGWGSAPTFDVDVQPSKLDVPDDSLGFARTAAGFWNTTLSPIQGAVLATTIARDGESMRPFIVSRVTDDAGHVDYEAPTPEPHRAIDGTVAQALTTMMEHTITEGTSYRAFHDAHRTPFVPVVVAGKTGTLSEGDHLYSWFVGFAPSHPRAGEHTVAIAVLVINRPRWHVKANVIAREMLRDYFTDRARVAIR